MVDDRIKHVIFSHGKESGPWGTKIQRLAKVAKNQSLDVISVDYRGIDDPLERVDKLKETITGLTGYLLVGSSLGGYVAAAAAEQAPAEGLFLMAPAVYVPGYDQYEIKKVLCPTLVVHGWRDEVIPVDSAWRFARKHRATLQVLDDDHRLRDSLPALEQLFSQFLASFGARSSG